MSLTIIAILRSEEDLRIFFKSVVLPAPEDDASGERERG